MDYQILLIQAATKAAIDQEQEIVDALRAEDDEVAPFYHLKAYRQLLPNARAQALSGLDSWDYFFGNMFFWWLFKVKTVNDEQAG
jgi:hypothetical protein